jgi:hypothetical protein
MKKVVLIVMALITLNCNAQLVVKESVKDSTVWQSKMSNLPKLVLFKTDEVESFTFYYRNAKYSTLTDVDYITTGDLETTKQFFELCQTVIAEDKEFEIQLSGKLILLSKSMGSAMVWMDGSYFYLTKKQVIEIIEKLN